MLIPKFPNKFRNLLINDPELTLTNIEQLYFY